MKTFRKVMKEAGYHEKTLTAVDLLRELSYGSLKGLPTEIRGKCERMVQTGRIGSAHHFTLKNWSKAFQEKVKAEKKVKIVKDELLEKAIIKQFRDLQTRNNTEDPIQQSLYFNRPQGHERHDGPLEVFVFRTPKSRFRRLLNEIFGT